jgi:hypothetical protein
MQRERKAELKENRQTATQRDGMIRIQGYRMIKKQRYRRTKAQRNRGMRDKGLRNRETEINRDIVTVRQ